jgi:hypothetical protein
MKKPKRKGTRNLIVLGMIVTRRGGKHHAKKERKVDPVSDGW